MKFSDLRTEIEFDLWLVALDLPDDFEAGWARISFSETTDDYHLIVNRKIISVRLRDSHLRPDFDYYLKRGCASLARILQMAPSGLLRLKILFFNGELIEMDRVEVGVGEEFLEAAGRLKLNSSRINVLAEELKVAHQLDVDGESYFLMLAGPAADDDFKAEKLESGCFSLWGPQWRVPVQKKDMGGGKEILWGTTVTGTKKRDKDGALRLVKGRLFFSDYSNTGGIRALVSGSLSKLLSSSGSYLKKWDEYGDIEGELLLKKTREVGALNYISCEPSPRGHRFYFDRELPDALQVGEAVEFVSSKPVYLIDVDMSWADYSKLLEQDFQEKQGKDTKGRKKQTSLNIPILSIETRCLELDIKENPGKDNFLIYSISGELVQIERRMKARKLILEGRSANPLLGLLIEEDGEIPNIRKSGKLKPLTPFVSNKIFRHPPTETQIKAIEIALNTPDIAIVQGPPGTGKTTVITAILERLNEEKDKTRSIRGEVLVSAVQHDAVENVVSRLSVNSIPALKFGGRLSADDRGRDLIWEKVRSWCGDIADKIRSSNPELVHTEEQRILSELLEIYADYPSDIHALNLLELVLKLPADIAGADLQAQAGFIRDDILEFSRSDNSRSSFLQVVRSLRIREASFLDDGPEKAMAVREFCADILNEEEKKVLKRAAMWRKGQALDFMKSLLEIKGRLLELYAPRPVYKISRARSDILTLIGALRKKLKYGQNTGNQKDTVLVDFLHELENNPEGIKEALSDYNYVYAATTQQAEGSEIRRAKKKDKNDFVKYDTVIVDEAARTSPRDLLIPMAQAEKRIILVGDHRQLPHIINDEVARQMEKGEFESDSFIKKSLFQYLFNRLRKLEKKDGIPRTITLDAQYRMHPLLGDFVSDNFYAAHQEGFRSPLGPDFFSHDLPDISGRAAVWLDVPHAKGDEQKNGYSRCRPAEAEAIAVRLKQWMDSEAGRKLSFGVISFYKAQVDLVFEALSRYGITQKGPEGWQISGDYRVLTHSEKAEPEERLRIGTVDSFQGMEFDVVFLSAVRTRNTRQMTDYLRHSTRPQEKMQGLFGHLMSENRLCVSMSRQKRVLVTAGDLELMETEVASNAVPALFSFAGLCREKGVILS